MTAALNLFMNISRGSDNSGGRTPCPLAIYSPACQPIARSEDRQIRSPHFTRDQERHNAMRMGLYFGLQFTRWARLGAIESDSFIAYSENADKIDTQIQTIVQR